MSLEILRLATRKPTHNYRTEIFLIEEVEQVIKQVEMPVFMNTQQNRAARKRAWVLQNKDRVNENHRRFHLKNIEIRRAYCRKYRRSERGREKQKAWIAANPEKHAEYQRAYKARNYERVMAKRREYETNPENVARRKAKEKEKYHAMTPEQRTEFNRKNYEKKKARMLITAKQLALKVGLAPTTVVKKLRLAGVKATKKNTRTNIDFGIATRDAQNYYNIHQAMKVLQP